MSEMSEEVFDRKNADELTLCIAERLGRRQEKIDRMAEWEREGRIVSWRPTILATLAIAACLVIALVVIAPWRNALGSPLDELGIEAPDFVDYRAAAPELSEIVQLIADKNYSDAIPKVEAALKQSDLELQGLRIALINSDDESLLYAEETEQVLNGELRWAYIYLLVRECRNEEAFTQLKLYLKMPSKRIQHENEAKALKKKLRSEKGIEQ